MQLDTLRDRIGSGLNKRFIAADFLDANTTDHDYDVIYAHAVLHHFRHMNVVLEIAQNKLAQGGRLITYDPLQTWLPIRLLRRLFRPFQSDADWEFPLTAEGMRQIEDRFLIVERLGVFNRGKWALILGVISPHLAKRYGDQLFEQDFKPGLPEASIKSSLHVSFLLTNRNSA